MFDPTAEDRVQTSHGVDRWRNKVRDEQRRLGRELTLCELLELAKGYQMTPEEVEAQRQSWARQMMD